jgi:hypothetical protein
MFPEGESSLEMFKKLSAFTKKKKKTAAQNV